LSHKSEHKEEKENEEEVLNVDAITFKKRTLEKFKNSPEHEYNIFPERS